VGRKGKNEENISEEKKKASTWEEQSKKFLALKLSSSSPKDRLEIEYAE
jgi:hypothetical protein